MPDSAVPTPDDPAWPLVRTWSAEAKNPHRLLHADDSAGAAALAALDGVTERSVLGALARHCAALVVDDWLVVLGAGGAGYPGLREFNGPDALEPLDGALVIALDMMGGGFAIMAAMVCRGPRQRRPPCARPVAGGVGRDCFIRAPAGRRHLTDRCGGRSFVMAIADCRISVTDADSNYP